MYCCIKVNEIEYFFAKDSQFHPLRHLSFPTLRIIFSHSFPGHKNYARPKNTTFSAAAFTTTALFSPQLQTALFPQHKLLWLLLSR